jgi:hypothetical protein
MGLYDTLLNNGSKYTAFDGQDPKINPLATKQSKMHADAAGVPSYSLNGSNFQQVNTDYQEYLDDDANLLPFPSQLDINGINPTTALTAPGVSSINDSFKNGEYLKNLPQ